MSQYSATKGGEKTENLSQPAEQMETTPGAATEKCGESKEGEAKSDKSTKKAMPEKSNVSVGNVTTIPIQDISRIANQTHRMSANSRNSNFLYLSAGASKLLPTKGTKPKPKKTVVPKPAKTGDDADIQIIHDDTESQGSSKKYIKVGESEDAQQSKDARDSNQANDPEEKGSKKKSKGSGDAGSSDMENENGKRPHSPDDRSYRRSQDRYKNRNYYDDDDEEYVCKVCEVTLNSSQTWYSHIEGKKHQKKLAAYQTDRINPYRSEDLQYVRKAEGCRINRREEPAAVPHIQPQIEGLDDPCVGLNFVSEIWRLDESLDDSYFCSLCGTTCMGVTVISHVVGYKHRLAYMRLFDTVNYEKVKKLTTKKSELTAALQVHAESLEKSLGPGQIKVEVEVEGFVPPLETGRCFQDSNVELTPFEMKTQIHHVAAQKPFIKIKCLVTTESNTDISELMKVHQHHQIAYSIDNLKATLSKYTATDTSLGKRLGRCLNTYIPYQLDEPLEFGSAGEYPMAPERFARPVPPSYGAERYGAMRGRTPPFNGPRQGRWQGNAPQSNYNEERSEQESIAAAVFDVERRHEMRTAQSGMPAGNMRTRNPAYNESGGGSVSQIKIPPYPFGTERRNEVPYNPQSLYQQPPPPPPPLPLPATAAAPPSTGREIWAPIQSRKSGGPNPTAYSGAANTTYPSGGNAYSGGATNKAYSGGANTYSGGANAYSGGANAYSGGANAYSGGANAYAGGVNSTYSGGANAYAGGVNSTYATGANPYSGGAHTAYANYANYPGNE